MKNYVAYNDFEKKTEKLPRQEKVKALKYMKRV